MLFFVLCIVATPFVFAAWLIHRILEHRTNMARALAGPRVPALPSPTSPDVEQRLANLEAIVASLDFDLVERLHLAERLRAADRGHAA